MASDLQVELFSNITNNRERELKDEIKDSIDRRMQIIGTKNEVKESKKVLLVKLSINVGEGLKDIIKIYKGDNSLELAQTFCKKHNIDESKLSNIALYIDNQMKAALQLSIEKEKAKALLNNGTNNNKTDISKEEAVKKSKKGIVLEISLGEGRSDEIKVRDGDNLRVLAENFVKKNNLPPKAVSKIESFITLKMQSLKSPPISPRSKSGDSDSSSDFGTRLYNEALKQSERLEQKKEEAQNELVKRRNSFRAIPLNNSDSFRDDQVKEEFSIRLYDNAKEKNQRLEQKKQEFENDLLIKRKNSFRASNSLDFPVDDEEEDFGKRLYDKALKRNESIENLRKKYNAEKEEIIRKNSFRALSLPPNSSDYNSNRVQKQNSFSDRLYELAMKQHNYLNTLTDSFKKEELEYMRENSFRAIPVVLGHAVVSKTHEYQNAGDRLYHESKDNYERRRSLIESKKEALRVAENQWTCVVCNGKNYPDKSYCQNLLDRNNAILKLKIQHASTKVARQLYKTKDGVEMCGIAKHPDFVPFVSSKLPLKYEEKNVRYIFDDKKGVTVAKPLHEVLHVTANERKEEMEERKQEALRREMDECTFSPQICEKSRVIDENKNIQSESINKTTNNGSQGLTRRKSVHALKQINDEDIQSDNNEILNKKEFQSRFDSLFYEGVKKKSLMKLYSEEQKKILELKECSFKPSINASITEMIKKGETVYDKLYSKALEQEMRLALLRSNSSKYDSNGKRLFTPQTGRKPNWSNTSEKIPIGELLFNNRHEFNDIKNVLREKEEIENRKYLLQGRARSDTIVNTMQKREIKSLFYKVIGHHNNLLSQEQLKEDEEFKIINQPNLESLPPSAKEIVEIVILNQNKMDFHTFENMFLQELKNNNILDQHSLFVKRKSILDRSESYATRGVYFPPEVEQELTFSPQINKNSEQIASSIRKKSQPVYEHLLKQGNLYKESRTSREVISKNKEMENCTFKPTINIPKGITSKFINKNNYVKKKKTVPVEKDLPEEVKKELTWQPKINKKSIKLAEKRQFNFTPKNKDKEIMDFQNVKVLINVETSERGRARERKNSRL